MKKILFLSLIMLCTAMSAWSQTTNNVALLFNDNTPSKTTNPETGISVQATPHTEDYHSAWKVYGANALELSVPQGYVITKVEFDYSGFFENGDCINQCDCLIFDTESETWVQKDGKLDYFSTIKFNAEHPAYVSAVYVYYHRCSGATYHEAVNATCTTKGKAEYWECTCGKFYSDADCTNMVTDMTSLDTEIDPTNHINGLQECLRVAPTCIATGTEHHWHCADCEQNFSDKEGKEKMTNLELSIDSTNHADLEEHARVEATCTKDGNIHYWHCNGCGKDFEDEDAEKEIADVTISKELASHNNLVYVEAKAATETEIGYTVNHWHCQDCGKNFEDQECTTPITDDVIIPITGTLNYLCFTANAVGSTVELIKKGKPNDVILQYSTDYCKNWETVDFETSSTTGTITLEKANDKVYFRNTRQASDVTGFSKEYKEGYNHYQFVMSGSIAASGNVMSLVDSDVETTTIPNEYCFADLFYECSALTSAPELPATTLKNYCYYEMFYRCTSLAKAPELPAMNLAEGCYYELFSCCKNLTIAPALPANEMKEYCYFRTFEDCISLTEGPELNAMNLAEDCYTQMFYGCTGLQFAPALPATELVYSCYDGMFFDCTNLQSAPELNALKLAEYCYLDMFRGCTSLKTAPTLPAQSLENYCYCGMFFDCTNLQSAPVLPAATMKLGCYYRMFEGCKSLTSAPSLPAKDLAERCYEYMFGNCTKLMIAPELPATELADSCYLEMFYGCEKLTEAPDLPATTLCTNCYNRMFVYCTNLKSIKVGFTDWYDNAATYEWLDGTAADGVFICPDELPMYYDWYYGVPYNWTRAYEVKANQDPDHKTNYYSTFYSGTNAYQVPEGVTAYTGVVDESASNPDESVLKLTAIESGVIPAEEPVILKASQSQVYLPYTTETASKNEDNELVGTDEAKTLGTNDYALSLGQHGVGFYLWNGKTIGANKAYLTLDEALGVKSLIFRFDDETTTTGINFVNENEDENENLYNLNGLRVGKDYKGIVIKNGKKALMK